MTREHDGALLRAFVEYRLTMRPDNEPWADSITAFLDTRHPHAYNPQFGDDKLCACGHRYYRHFDTYEDMAPVGCKYCGCPEWHDG
jgi:hypothetical protein